MAGTSATESGGGRRFNLLRVLGEGSFGSVYLADMEGAGGFKRRVALKLLNDAWDPGSDAGRRLRDEARLLGRLDHANIVRVDDLVRVNGRWALVMEYVSGADVETVFAWAERRAEPIPPRAAVEICAAVATALVAAWDAPGEGGEPLRVVHRDIKPSNVRLTDTGAVKVLDFGVARAEFAGREAQTERVRYGSLGYMAPERILGGPDAGAGDVYALAVMLYELLTLKTYGRAELGLERQAAQVDSARDALEAVLGDGPLVVLLVRSLAYTPEDRPTVAELDEGLWRFARALPGDDLPTYARRVLPLLGLPRTSTATISGTILEESASGGNPVDAQRVSSATLVVDPLTQAATVPLAPVESAPPARRAPVAVVLAGFLGVILVGVLVLAALWPKETPPAEPPPVPTASATPAPTPAEAAPPAVALASPAPTPAVAGPGAAPVATPESLAAPRPGTTRRERTTGASTAATPTPAITPTVATAPAAAPTGTGADGPRLRAAKFTLTGAAGIRVTCGDVLGTGDASTLLRNFPAGPCTVVAGGDTTTIQLDSPRGVACVVEGGSLTCR